MTVIARLARLHKDFEWDISYGVMRVSSFCALMHQIHHLSIDSIERSTIVLVKTQIAGDSKSHSMNVCLQSVTLPFLFCSIAIMV